MMPPTLANPKPAVSQNVISFYLPVADIPHNNGAILNIAHVIRHVMASKTEAELAAYYIMAREAVYIRIILHELRHKKPTIPLEADNAMAEAVINGKIQQNRQKPWTCVFTGSAITNAMNNFTSIGILEN